MPVNKLRWFLPVESLNGILVEDVLGAVSYS